MSEDLPEVGIPFVIKVSIKPDGRMPFRDKTNRVQGDATVDDYLADWVRKMAAGKPVLYMWARREPDGNTMIFTGSLPKQNKRFEQFDKVTA
jgi:hypothetical protein